VSTRTYLSIGDVLSLLREEFPDVTISKIRFLESQGLVNPERSPSGYRKFYEADVERLRWVLRQQREHFLPLKVIRDRLDQEGGEESPEPAVVGRPVGVATAGPAPDRSHVGEPTPGVAEMVSAAKPSPAPAATGVLGGTRSLPDPNAERSSPKGNGGLRSARADEAAVARTVGVAGATTPMGATASRGAPPESVGTRAEGSAPRPASTGTDLGGSPPARAPDADRTPSAAAERQSPPVPQASPGSTPAVPAPDQPPRPSPRRDPARAEAESAAGHPPQPGPGGSAGASGPAGEARAEMPAGVSGASLTLEELCAASGLPMTEVASLEGFGLVEPMSVAGVLYYDEEALVVAKLVASYRRYGIEPRHLRLYRNAVDREMGLVEQIVTPLLRQRNPEARQRAADAAADLAKLGQQLRGSLLRREIRRQLGS
jgi:DNA-binding transcriptional MerR regulator